MKLSIEVVAIAISAFGVACSAKTPVAPDSGTGRAVSASQVAGQTAGRVAAQDYGRNALWQIGLSFNCNNPGFCGSELGGFWGWIEFDSGGEGDATLTGCGHLVAAGGPNLAGADHFNADITGWTVMPGSAGPSTFFVTSGTMTLTGGTGGPPITVPIAPTPLDTGIPAVAGHYNSSQILGLNAPPGVAYQVQVVQLNH